MKKLHRFTLNFLLFFVFGGVQAQDLPVSIGNWRTHAPSKRAIAVADAGDRVFSASSYGLFSYHKTEGSFYVYSRINGLSDFGISGIRFDPSTRILLIAYSNSNIDLLQTSTQTITNLSDIKRKNIVGGKKINDILFIDKKAYLATEFGIVVVDLERNEIKDTYYIGPNGSSIIINSLAYDGTSLLATTENGVFTASYNDPNIFNFTAWTKETGLSEPNKRYTSSTAFNGNFIVVKTDPAFDEDTLYIRENGNWRVLLNSYGEGGEVDTYNGYFLYNNFYQINAYDNQFVQVRSVDNNVYQDAAIEDGFLDTDNTFWVADNRNGLVRQIWAPYNLSFLNPSGPNSEAVWAMDSRGGSLWVASGSLNGDAVNYDQRNGTYLYRANEWKSFDRLSDTLYNRLVQDGVPAMVAVAVDPADPNHAFFGNWRGGVIEYTSSGGVRQYNESNSTLRPINGLPGYIITGGVTFDAGGNLWVISGGTTSPLHVRNTSGNWQSFVVPNANIAAYGLYQILVDDFGTKWWIARSGASQGQGICIYNENDLSNPNDNTFRQLNDRTGTGGLPDNFVRCMAKDKDGAIWVGTNKGVAVFYNPGNVVSGSNYDAQRIIIEQDGYAQYLLESEYVTAAAVDGANRKWFGTYSGGAFLLSEDGTEQIHNFNTSNSPLPSNNIIAIAIDEVTGEVFFGTDKGIVSYRSDATEGGDYCDNYYAFPNPVKHDYSGPIAIRGLVTDADVKITDTAGNIVYHTKALGGQAVWDGKDFSGRRAATGIYFVHVTNEDGTGTCVTKLLMAN